MDPFYSSFKKTSKNIKVALRPTKSIVGPRLLDRIVIIILVFLQLSIILIL